MTFRESFFVIFSDYPSNSFIDSILALEIYDGHESVMDRILKEKKKTK